MGSLVAALERGCCPGRRCREDSIRTDHRAAPVVGLGGRSCSSFRSHGWGDRGGSLGHCSWRWAAGTRADRTGCLRSIGVTRAGGARGVDVLESFARLGLSAWRLSRLGSQIGTSLPGTGTRRCGRSHTLGLGTWRNATAYCRIDGGSAERSGRHGARMGCWGLRHCSGGEWWLAGAERSLSGLLAGAAGDGGDPRRQGSRSAVWTSWSAAHRGSLGAWRAHRDHRARGDVGGLSRGHDGHRLYDRGHATTDISGRRVGIRFACNWSIGCGVGTGLDGPSRHARLFVGTSLGAGQDH